MDHDDCVFDWKLDMGTDRYTFSDVAAKIGCCDPRIPRRCWSNNKPCCGKTGTMKIVGGRNSAGQWKLVCKTCGATTFMRLPGVTYKSGPESK